MKDPGLRSALLAFDPDYVQKGRAAPEKGLCFSLHYPRPLQNRKVFVVNKNQEARSKPMDVRSTVENTMRSKV
jgi:hypothetical protein